MGLDLRVPIGGMFSAVGLLLCIYGLITNGDAGVYQKSLGFNVNLIWGAAMLVFGLLFLAFGLRSSRSAPTAEVAPEPVEASRPGSH